MRRLIGLIAALVCTAGPAMAQGDWKTTVTKPSTWSGCYIGVHAGMSATKTDTTLDATGTGTLLGVNGLGSAGSLAGVHAGCDMQVQQFVFGGFGDYTWHNQSLEITSPLAAMSIAKLDVNSQWTIGGRAGLVFGNSLVYGLVGWTRVETSDIALLGGTMSLVIPTLEGWTFGGGIATEIMPNIRLSAEYRYARFDKVDVPLFPGATLGLQPDMHTAMARLSYSFSFGQ